MVDQVTSACLVEGNNVCFFSNYYEIFSGKKETECHASAELVECFKIPLYL